MNNVNPLETSVLPTSSETLDAATPKGSGSDLVIDVFCFPDRPNDQYARIGRRDKLDKPGEAIILGGRKCGYLESILHHNGRLEQLKTVLANVNASNKIVRQPKEVKTWNDVVFGYFGLSEPIHRQVLKQRNGQTTTEWRKLSPTSELAATITHRHFGDDAIPLPPEPTVRVKGTSGPRQSMAETVRRALADQAEQAERQRQRDRADMMEMFKMMIQTNAAK